MTAASCLGHGRPCRVLNKGIVPDPHQHLIPWDVWTPDGCGGEQRIIKVRFFPPQTSCKNALNPLPVAGREGSKPRAKLGMEQLWQGRFAPSGDAKNASMPKGDLLFHSASLYLSNTRTSLHFLHPKISRTPHYEC